MKTFMGAYAVLGARLAANRAHKVIVHTSPPARMARSAEQRDKLLDGVLLGLGFGWETIDGEKTLTRPAAHILGQLGNAYPDDFAFNGR
jgi:hypothetical protein